MATIGILAVCFVMSVDIRVLLAVEGVLLGEFSLATLEFLLARNGFPKIKVNECKSENGSNCDTPGPNDDGGGRCGGREHFGGKFDPNETFDAEDADGDPSHGTEFVAVWIGDPLVVFAKGGE